MLSGWNKRLSNKHLQSSPRQLRYPFLGHAKGTCPKPCHAQKQRCDYFNPACSPFLFQSRPTTKCSVGFSKHCFLFSLAPTLPPSAHQSVKLSSRTSVLLTRRRKIINWTRQCKPCYLAWWSEVWMVKCWEIRARSELLAQRVIPSFMMVKRPCGRSSSQRSSGRKGYGLLFFNIVSGSQLIFP